MRALAAVGAALALALPLQAQQTTMGIGAEYLGYTFDEGLGYEAAQLLLTPLAVRVPVGTSLSLDLYAAWAQGKVEVDDVSYTLDGPVDTRLKASWQATPWALVSFGVSLPTGNATHDGAEAIVASTLSADLLGFREATWGTGLAMTSSVATAMRLGEFGIGLAGAYSVRGEFEPSAEQELIYEPGDEARVRIGFDRNFGTNTLTGGVTFSTYAEDQAQQGGAAARNLFQAGNRIRGDLAFAFRAGAGIWTLYAADVWRENGDLTLAVVDGTGAEVGDTTLVTAEQNLVVAGLQGTVGLGGGFVFRPMVDVRLQQREDAEGNTRGSGWIMGAGGDLPLRLFGGYDVFPKARVLFGSIEDGAGVGRGVLGGEFSATIRWGF